jgi:protein subunit release factor A
LVNNQLAEAAEKHIQQLQQQQRETTQLKSAVAKQHKDQLVQQQLEVSRLTEKVESLSRQVRQVLLPGILILRVYFFDKPSFKIPFRTTRL